MADAASPLAAPATKFRTRFFQDWPVRKDHPLLCPREGPEKAYCGFAGLRATGHHARPSDFPKLPVWCSKRFSLPAHLPKPRPRPCKAMTSKATKAREWAVLVDYCLKLRLLAACAALEPKRRLLLLYRIDQQLPPQIARVDLVLPMVLWREDMAASDCDFITQDVQR